MLSTMCKVYVKALQFIGETKDHNVVSSLSTCRDFSVAPAVVK